MSFTLLYAEDEENDALFLEIALARDTVGVALHVVGDGKRAVAWLAGDSDYADRSKYPLPDLILLDLNLPLRSGLEVLAWIRTAAGLGGRPVVLLSSSGRESDRRAAERLGADLYLVKPVSGDQLGSVVRELGRRWFPDRLKLT